MKRLTIYICFWFLTTSFIKNKNIIEVDITTNEMVLVDHEYVEVDNLCDSLNVLFFNYKFSGQHYPRHESDRSKVVVSLYSYRNVTYRKYIEVYDKIEQAYNHAWNTIAFSKYSRPFEKLSEPKKNEIKRVLPKKISEADPV